MAAVEQNSTLSHAEHNPDDGYYPEEEEVVTGEWVTPTVKVHPIEQVSGEEDETVFWTHRSKLYRWASETSEWKERGLGDSKLLQHNDTGRIRFLLRQEKTLKVVANHYVVPKIPYCNLEKNAGSDKIWVWSAPDFSEATPIIEQFALKFGQVEQAKIFAEKFHEACMINKEKFGIVDDVINNNNNDNKKNDNNKDDSKDENKAESHTQGEQTQQSTE
eukprot:GHVR01134178.1.p1 GENE.GHVR01134178.1~~GHVR01134178.1.p1  ORF type:complete len:218 (+),score=71.19 GHVR01134178.1:50-703(+)